MCPVCIVDPKDIATPDPLRHRVPATFLPELARGTFDLGDADEPTNSYSFGKPAEFFQLRYVGKCQCQSGYVGIITADKLGKAGPAWDWEAFRRGIDQETLVFPDEASGFLFAGPVVQSNSVSVFKHEEGGEVDGLLITSDVEEMD